MSSRAGGNAAGTAGTAGTAPLPENIHISTHPLLHVKLSTLRSASSPNVHSTYTTRALVHEISLILATEVLSKVMTTRNGPADTTLIGHPYTTSTISPSRITLVPVLRSGLAMLDAFHTILHPLPTVPVHHLGLYRETSTLQPVEYYNNLPFYRTEQPPSQTPVQPPAPNSDQSQAMDTSTTKNTPRFQSGSNRQGLPELALILDPLIATGGTASAAISTLLEWGVRRVVLVSILAERQGLLAVAAAAEEAVLEQAHLSSSKHSGTSLERLPPPTVEIYCGAVDEMGLNAKGMIVPGLGDVGDRLFGTLGR